MAFELEFERTRNYRVWPFVAATLLAAPMIAFAVFRFVPGPDAALMAPAAHFWLVSVACLLALSLSIILVVSARSIRETRVLFLALSFLTLAAIFSVHGLLTLGHVHDGVTAPDLDSS